MRVFSTSGGPYHIGNSCTFHEIPQYSTADYVIDTVIEMQSLIESKVFEDLSKELLSPAFRAFFSSKANQPRVLQIFLGIYQGFPVRDKITGHPIQPTLQCVPHPWADPTNIGWDCASSPGKAAYTKKGNPYEIFHCPLFYALRETANVRSCTPRSRMVHLFQNRVAALIHQLFYIYAEINNPNMQTCAIESVTRAVTPGPIFGAGKCIPEPSSIEAVTRLAPDEQVKTAQNFALYASVLAAGCDMEAFVEEAPGRRLAETNATVSEPDIPLPSGGSRKLKRFDA